MMFLKSLSDDARILLLIAAFWMPVMLMTGVYAFRDARRCNRNPVLWAFISAFAPCLIGFIIYLTTRDISDKEQEGVKPTGKLLQNILVAILLIPALLMGAIAGVMNFTEGNYLFLTRHDTDATLRGGFLDVAYYDTDEWYSFTRTNADGSSVTVEQHFGNYRITRTSSEVGIEIANWDFSYGGRDHAPWGRYANLHGDLYRELSGPYDDMVLEAGGSYYRNEVGQIFLYQLEHGMQMKPQTHFCVSLSYDDTGRIVRQQLEDEQRDEYGTLLELTPEESNLRYVTYTYDDAGKLIRSEQYNHLDELQKYTDYLFTEDGAVRIASTFTAAGDPVSTSISRFDGAGELEKQEFFDANGLLTHSVAFGNDVVAFLLLDSTTMMLMILWGATMVITILMLLPEKKKA